MLIKGINCVTINLQTTTMHPSEYPSIARFSSKCVFHQITAVGKGHDEIVDSDDAVEASIAVDEQLSG